MRRAHASVRTRGFVLLAALVVVGAAILVATGAIFAARAATAASASAVAERTLRSAALDGVAMAADQLASQRAALLAGGTPRLEPKLLDVASGGDTIEVVLVPLRDGEFVESESAKIDLNDADDATVARLLADAGDELGALVAAARAARPLGSVDGAAGLVAAGERERALIAALGARRSLGDLETPREDSTPSLVSLFTVHAREALVASDGAPRMDLVAAAGEDGAERADASLAQFDDAVREVLEEVARAAARAAPNDDGAIARALAERGVSTEDMLAVLDRCTLLAGELAPARLDIQRADLRALAAIEGIGAERAARIVDLRDSLDAEERRSTAWLVSRRVMDAGAHAAVAARISHRSTSWRARVEARLVRAGSDEAGEPAAAEPTAAFDCIVDLSGERPRLAYLREITLLPTARLLARKAQEESMLSRQFDEPATERAAPSDEGEAMVDEVVDAVADEASARDDDAADGDAISQPRARSPLESAPSSATLGDPGPRRPARGQTAPFGRDVGARGIGREQGQR